MYENVREYIKKDRSDRRNHLKLDSPCLEIGGSSGDCKAMLAVKLKTSIPSKRDKILVCHACNNSGCTNVDHLYWGTPTDNFIDMKESGNFESIYARGLKKHGHDEWHKLLRERQIKANIKRAEKERKNYEQYRVLFETTVKNRGWVTLMAKKLEISHTHVRRIERILSNTGTTR